ncbi:MAG: AraC family transcriptional regulator [Verrucomicrobiota bacterium]
MALAIARVPRSASPARDASAVSGLMQCQGLLKQRLRRPLLDLFHELTGLHLHVWWHETVAGLQTDNLPKLCPTARKCPEGRFPEACEACQRIWWQQVGNGQQTEQRFAGLCGSINYYGSFEFLGLRPVTLLLQQIELVSPAGELAFTSAVSLTQLIIHDLKATLEAGRVIHEAGRTDSALAARERAKCSESARSRRISELAARSVPAELARCGSGAPETFGQQRGVSHSQQIVQQMLDYIHEHYCSPIQLDDLARAVNMNADYVSNLFSATMGMTFHRYLEDLRLARAKSLLRDPLKRVCEVAYAVGYPNPNHFRNVFKTRVGMPPSAWRETSESASHG